MNNTIYDKNNILEIKTKFNEYNEEISKSLANIDRELAEITKVLNTPKSSKKIPEFIEYFKAQEQMINEATQTYNNRFDTIINEYASYMNDVNKMVGENNEKE